MINFKFTLILSVFIFNSISFSQTANNYNWNNKSNQTGVYSVDPINVTPNADSITLGDSKTNVNFKMGDQSIIRKFVDKFSLTPEERAQELKIKTETEKRMKLSGKELFTPKGMASSYMGQSFLFFFWLGAAQVYHCYNDYSLNPMACYQYLLSETSGVHRAALMAFVVASGLVSTSPWVYNLGFKMLKRNRFTQSFMSALSLSIGVTGQSVLTQFLQYYLQDEDVKRCSNKFIIKQKLAEKRRFGNKVNLEEVIPENDPCRLAADKSTTYYLKKHLPPEILGLWATMPVLFALETSLGLAISPTGIGVVAGLKSLTEFLSQKIPVGGLTKGAQLEFYVTMEKISEKLGSIYKMSFNLKKNSKLFRLAEYILKPGSWWYSGLNLLAFTEISGVITPWITEKWFKNISSDFDENNETFMRTMADMGSADARTFFVQEGCDDSNVETCEPRASLFLSQLRMDFAHWRELKMQSFVSTYQGWQQKIQEMVRGFNSTLMLYNDIAMSTFKNKAITPPWKKSTTLAGVYTLVPDNIDDERKLFQSPIEYYGPMSERAFIIGLGLKAYITFYANESKLNFKTSLPKMNKEKMYKLLMEEFEESYKGVDYPEAKVAYEGLKVSSQLTVQDFEKIFGSVISALHKSNHSDTIRKFIDYSGNTNYLKWLERLDQIANKLMPGFLLNSKLYGYKLLRFETTAVKKFVQMPENLKKQENESYTHPIFLDEQKDSHFSYETPMKIFGTDPELVRVIEIVGQLYYKNILRNSDYMYYMTRAQYKDVQEGINDLMGVVNFVNTKDINDWMSSAITKTFPKLVEWGWISKDSLTGLFTLSQKVDDFLLQIPASFAAKTINSTPMEEITRITNTIYSGLGNPFAPQNEAHAYKERYLRYTSEGRNQQLYSLPEKTKRIFTKTIFDSMVIGMICGPEKSASIFKNSNVAWSSTDAVDFKGIFPDKFKPFKMVSLESSAVRTFCSKSINDQETLNKVLPEAFNLIETELGTQKLPDVSQETLSPEYGGFLVSLYCNITEWDKDAKASGKSNSWSIKSKTWAKYESLFCSKDKDSISDDENDDKEKDKNSFTAADMNGLISETNDLVNSLTTDERDELAKASIKTSKGKKGLGTDDVSVNEEYSKMKLEAFRQVLAIKGTLVLVKILDNYQLMYNSKLPALMHALVGTGDEVKSTLAKVSFNYEDFDTFHISNTKDYENENINPNVISIKKNDFQSNIALSLLQESSYYLAFLNKVYTYNFNQNSRFQNKDSALIMQFSPPIEKLKKSATIFEKILMQIGSVDTKTNLPRAPLFIWKLNNLVTGALISIIQNNDQQSQKILTELSQYIDYLDIYIFKVKLGEDKYSSEGIDNLIGSYTADGIKELNLPASERAVMRTWLVHFRSFVSDLMSITSMLKPMNLENANSMNAQ